VGNVLALAPGTRYIQEPFNRETNATIDGYRLGNMYAHAPDEDETRLKSSLLSFLPDTAPQCLLLKDPIALFSAPWLQDQLGVRVLCLVRHPAGFVSSLIKWQWEFCFAYWTAQPKLMQSLPEDWRKQVERYAVERQEPLLQACLLWKCLYGWAQLQNPRRRQWQMLRYEDLARNPLSAFRKLFHRLELDWSPEVAEGITRLSGAENPSESDDPGFKARNSRAMKDAWKHRLSPAQIARIRKETAPVWKSYYAPWDW
jgi:hypothetical protein